MAGFLKIAIAVALMAFSIAMAQAEQTKFSPLGLDKPTAKTSVVFIPGIMGSRLQLGDQVIWGDFPYDPELLVYRGENEIAVASPLKSIAVSGWDIKDRAYGNYFRDSIMDLEAEDWFRPFSYDWRASNEISARMLNSFLCAEVDQQGRPILIVAHSMGGLVLKLWLANHYSSGCSNRQGQRIEIAGIIFVATPHYGAPDTVTTMLTGSPDLFPVLENYYMPEMGTVGLSFDSIYELLPMQHAFEGAEFDDSALCLPNLTATAGAKRMRVFHRDSRGEYYLVNLFSSTVWGRLGVSERVTKLLTGFAVQANDAETYLQAKLDRARNVSCNLARFQMPAELQDKVIYLAGSLTENRAALSSTVDEILISDLELDDTELDFEVVDGLTLETKYIYINYGPGDTTVPEDIATFGRNQHARRENADHMGILSSFAFQDVLDVAQTRADLGARSSYGFWIDPAAEQPIFKVAKALNFAGVEAPLENWVVFASDSELPEAKGIDINRLSDIVRVMSEQQRSAALSAVSDESDIVRKIFLGEIGSNKAAAEFLFDSERSAEDSHFLATVPELSTIDRAKVALIAADEYFLMSEPDLARSMYGLAEYSAQRAFLEDDDSKGIMERAAIGYRVSNGLFVSVEGEKTVAEEVAVKWSDYIASPSSERLSGVEAALATASNATPNFSIDASEVSVVDELGVAQK